MLYLHENKLHTKYIFQVLVNYYNYVSLEGQVNKSNIFLFINKKVTTLKF